MMKSAYLKSTNSNETLSINALEEFDSKGESLEVIIEDISNAKIDSSSKVFHQYADFFHFPLIDAISLGEGNTPLIEASDKMNQYLGCNILLKNEKVIKLPEKNYLNLLTKINLMLDDYNFAKYKIFDFRIIDQLILQ